MNGAGISSRVFNDGYSRYAECGRNPGKTVLNVAKLQKVAELLIGSSTVL